MLLTIKDLSKQLQVKPSTLYAWAAQGKIPCIKLNGLVRFAREEIETWVEAGRRDVPVSRSRLSDRGASAGLKVYVARLRQQGHNRSHGEIRPKSGLIRKEETDGAV